MCKWTFRTSCFSLPMNDVEFIMFCCSIGLVPEIICVQVLCELLKMILLCGSNKGIIFLWCSFIHSKLIINEVEYNIKFLPFYC